MPNLWDAFKVVFGGNSLAVNTYIKKKDLKPITQSSTPEIKKEQTKVGASGRKTVLKTTENKEN